MCTQEDNIDPPIVEQKEREDNPSPAPNYEERINRLDERIQALVEENNALKIKIDSLDKKEDKQDEPKPKIKTYY